MADNSFLLYGANGYTGELIARHAKDYDLQPILAGRREEVIKPLANQLDCAYIVFGVDNTSAVNHAVGKVKVVLNAAGPFQFTAKQMIEGCVECGTHYLDINGDVSVFEFVRRYDDVAKRAGIMVLPGAGFDVVPTDCTALFLKKLVPDAVALKLAFASLGGGLSHGTATTMVSKLGKGGAVRKDGKIISVPLGHRGMWVDFGERKLFVMTIPWGDVATAYYTTGIPNIESYAAVSPAVYRLLKFQSLYNWFLRTNFLRSLLQRRINRRVPGPTTEQRRNAASLIWGQAQSPNGSQATVRMRCDDGYTLTMQSTLLITKKILSGDYKPGYQTPASAYSEDLVMDLPHVTREIIEQ